MLTLGQIVFSKQGRDKGKAFLIVALTDNYVFLADGALRRLDNPKKKKPMHIQITKDICLEIKEKLEKNQYLNDADLRKALRSYQS